MKNETQWEIDQSQSSISFRVTHLISSGIKGYFSKFTANIFTAEKDFSKVKLDLKIDAATISTGNGRLDEYLRSNDLFDLQHHNHILFTSHEMGKDDDSGKQHLWGDITIKGVTKRIMLYVERGGVINDLSGNNKAEFKLSGKINLTDWGLKCNQSLDEGDLFESKELEIVCDIGLFNKNEDELICDLDSRDDSYAKPL